MAEKIKNRLFIFLFILLLAPFIQKNLPFVESGRLYGDFTNAGDVDFTWKTWFDGSYRDNKGKFHNDQCGFRRDLVRLNNQIDFSLFNKIHSFSVIIGKENCLFQEAYITAYYGEDFIGNDSAKKLMLKVKAIQDTLGKLGKSLILVYAPCKAFYYPEHIPDNLKKQFSGQHNFGALKRAGDSLQVNQIDFNSWFLSMKHTSKDSLFSKQGIHWTVYGSILAADSLTRYVERLRNIQMLHLVHNEIEHTPKPRDTDDDLYKTLNTIVPFVKETFSYPKVIYKEDSTKTKPNVIYIGDSYAINFIHNGMTFFANADWEFWFYFNRILNRENANYPESWGHMTGYNWMEKIDKSDYVVMLYTSHNLAHMGDGFIEKAYGHYYPAKQP
jgi:hypothetical protein